MDAKAKVELIAEGRSGLQVEYPNAGLVQCWQYTRKVPFDWGFYYYTIRQEARWTEQCLEVSGCVEEPLIKLSDLEALQQTHATTITDHEAALAELQASKDALNASWHSLLDENRALEQRNATLLTGLEALAGELELKLPYAKDPDATYSFGNNWVDVRNCANAEAARRIRTLTNSAKDST